MEPLALIDAYNARTPLRSLLIERRLARDAPGWERVPVSAFEIESMPADEPWLKKLSQVYVGGESITVRDTKTRYLHTGSWPCTNGELAREYLTLVFGKKRRVNPRPEFFTRTAPLYCQPHRGDFAYVDLAHAYWEILHRFPPDICFVDPGRPDQRFIVPHTGTWWLNEEQVDEDRRLRHAVAGVLFSKGIKFFHHGELRTVTPWVGHHRPSLYRITMDLLNAIALDVSRHFTLFAWLTDAAIVRASQGPALQEFLAERWDFPSEIKAHGKGAIHSVGSYRMGERHDETGRWTEDQMNAPGPREPRPLKKIARVNVTFWREQRKRIWAR